MIQNLYIYLHIIIIITLSKQTKTNTYSPTRQLSMKPKVEGLVVCKNFRLTKKLGTGAFGEIYMAVNRSNEEQVYAAKLEDATSKNPQLFFEAKLYKYLNTEGQEKGIPRVYAANTEGAYNIMLMDLLGKSLEDLFVEANKKFSLKTVIMLGMQMLDRIEFLHNKQFLHRDIKPDNFLMGRKKNASIVYMIDLGLSKKYIKEAQPKHIDPPLVTIIGKHIPYRDGKELTGTARYASINTHIGIEQARRDDIESIGYVMMYFLRGILPWQNMKAKDTRQKYALIMEKKMSTPTEVLCKGYPNQLVKYLNYAKNLKFEEKPDYKYLRQLLDEVRIKNGFQMDYVYDWTAKGEDNLGTNLGTKPELRKESSKEQQPLNNGGATFGSTTKVYNASNSLSKEVPVKQAPTNYGMKTTTANNNQEGLVNIFSTVQNQKIAGPKISVIKQ